MRTGPAHIHDTLKKIMASDAMEKLSSAERKKIAQLCLVSQEDLEEKWNAVITSFLQSWDMNMQNLREQIHTSLSNPELREKTTFFESRDLFSAQVEEKIQDLAHRINFTYHQNMLNNWNKSSGANFHCAITEFIPNAAHNAWNGPARNSTGIQKHQGSVSGSKMPIDAFPELLQDSIRDGQKLYEEIQARREGRRQISGLSHFKIYDNLNIGKLII